MMIREDLERHCEARVSGAMDEIPESVVHGCAVTLLVAKSNGIPA
jgi:hypothetical protein